MSKNNPLKLKQVKEQNIKYNGIKDVEIISPTYSRHKGPIDKNTIQSTRNSNQLTKQISKINIKLKVDEKEEKEEEDDKDEKDKNNEQEKELEKIREKIREKGSISSDRKNNKYKEKIKELEEKIKQMNIDYTNDIQKHKDEIEKNEKDMKKLINTNTNLKNSLEILTQRLDKFLINTNNQKIKIINKKNESNLEDLKHQLEVKEKELKNQQRLINILKKDNTNIRNILNGLRYDENNLNLVEKVNQQYQEILTLQKNFKEYKQKYSSQKNIKDDFSPKKKKLVLNSLSPQRNGFLTTKNKSQSTDTKKYLNERKKKYEYHGISSSFNYDKNNSNSIGDSIFSSEEKIILKNLFIDDEDYKNFMNKINILEKSSIIKEKEMTMKIKLIENKLKEKEKELEQIKKESKEKDNAIIVLNVENKELKKISNELNNKLNLLSNTLNELEQKNQDIMKKNERIKKTIFSIDGIMEGKSKEGKIIPIVKEPNNNMEETSRIKDIKEEKNKNNLNFSNSNSDEAGSDN